MNLPHRSKAVGKKFSTATYILFNLGQLGLSVEDSKKMSFKTYLNLCDLNYELNNKQQKKQATQEDIDKFLG